MGERDRARRKIGWRFDLVISVVVVVGEISPNFIIPFSGTSRMGLEIWETEENFWWENLEI